MWSYTDRPQEAMAQSLNDPLQEGQTYSLTFNAQSTDYEGGQWFTPQDIPVKFEILDQNGNLLGETIVQEQTTKVTKYLYRPCGRNRHPTPSQRL